MSQQFSKVSRGILRKAPRQMKELRLANHVTQRQCRYAHRVCPLCNFLSPSDVFAAHGVPRDFIYLWIFFEERQPADVFSKPR